jgi:hypothetical protein
MNEKSDILIHAILIAINSAKVPLLLFPEVPIAFFSEGH